MREYGRGVETSCWIMSDFPFAVLISVVFMSAIRTFERRRLLSAARFASMYALKFAWLDSSDTR